LILTIGISNGIRYSITDLNPATARTLPMVYVDRYGISLYDAQYKDGQKIPIPQETINKVLAAMWRFKRTCRDFGVPNEQIKIIATEATRVALNSAEYRQAIKDKTGWDVTMLPKEIEGRTGAYGVASSFPKMKGLMMDLGGGSTQITWCITKNGEMTMSPAGSVSMPYGAAALTRNIAEAKQKGPTAEKEFEDGLVAEFKAAVEKIAIPQELIDMQNTAEGLNMCCSGGGFRGWGFMCMNEDKVQPYPIPIINGYKVSTQMFENTSLITAAAKEEEDVFRVSERRTSQVPAVACLIRCVLKAIPAIKSVYFAQGGVREGYLFSNMDNATRAQYPMETCTRPFAMPSSRRIADILIASAPSDLEFLRKKDCAREHLIVALAQAMFIHGVMNKDIQAASALRSTTTGVFAAVNGADHEERACLALMLCERWGGVGALSPSDAEYWKRICALLRPELAWWCLWFGRVAFILAQRYPAGIIDDEDPIKITSHWITKESVASDEEGLAGKHGKKHKFDKALKHDKQSNKAGQVGVRTLTDADAEEAADVGDVTSPSGKKAIVVSVFADPDTLESDNMLKAIKGLEKLGKKKNWPASAGGFKIETHVNPEGKPQ
jgi:retrograde regulation protein 2